MNKKIASLKKEKDNLISKLESEAKKHYENISDSKNTINKLETEKSQLKKVIE